MSETWSLLVECEVPQELDESADSAEEACLRSLTRGRQPKEDGAPFLIARLLMSSSGSRACLLQAALPQMVPASLLWDHIYMAGLPHPSFDLGESSA